jgi:transposase
MADKYLVDLTSEEQGYLLDVVRKGKTTARRVARAHVLLRAAEGAADEEIAETLHLGLSTVHRTRQRFVDEGLTVALSEQSRSGSPPALTGKQAAFLIALACSTPPAGRHRWTLKLLADRFVELRQIDMISPDTVGRVLKKRLQTVATPRMVYSQCQSRLRLAYGGCPGLVRRTRRSPVSPSVF